MIEQETIQNPTPIPGPSLLGTSDNGPALANEKEKANDDSIEYKLRLTQLGNAKRMVSRYGHLIRFCPPLKKWLYWDGARWSVDETGRVYRFATKTVLAIYAEVSDSWDSPMRDAVVKWARKSESRNEIEAMIGLARYEPGIPALPRECDSNPFLLNCLNGTIELRTGKLRPHDRKDMLMKLAPVNFDPNAKCPLWLGTLYRLLAGNQELIDFFQRMIGYTLTGAVSEKALFVFVGDGNNGKTTLLEVIRSIMGDYAGSVDVNDLMQKPNGDDSARQRAVADLLGKRFITSSETQEGQKLNEQLIKQLTGMGVLRGRRIYGEGFEFAPLFKLFIDANYVPAIRGVDNAIWNRIKLIPFNVMIPESEQDKQLRVKLINEGPGILAWAVEGCLKWQREGLGAPSAVNQAVRHLRDDMDVVAEFIDDCCVIESGVFEPSARLYERYKLWSELRKEPPMTQASFGTRLAKKGFGDSRGSTGRRRNGIKLKPEPGARFLTDSLAG